MNAQSKRKGFSLVGTIAVLMATSACGVLLWGYLKGEKMPEENQPPTGSFVQMKNTHFIQSVRSDGIYELLIDGVTTVATGPKGLTTDDEVIVLKWQEHNPLADSDEIFKVEPAN